jgi:hypothetical protein
MLTRIPDKNQREDIKRQSREEIRKRNKENASVSQEDSGVIAIRNV